MSAASWQPAAGLDHFQQHHHQQPPPPSGGADTDRQHIEELLRHCHRRQQDTEELLRHCYRRQQDTDGSSAARALLECKFREEWRIAREDELLASLDESSFVGSAHFALFARDIVLLAAKATQRIRSFQATDSWRKQSSRQAFTLDPEGKKGRAQTAEGGNRKAKKRLGAGTRPQQPSHSERRISGGAYHKRHSRLHQPVLSSPPKFKLEAEGPTPGQQFYQEQKVHDEYSQALQAFAERLQLHAVSAPGTAGDDESGIHAGNDYPYWLLLRFVHESRSRLHAAFNQKLAVEEKRTGALERGAEAHGEGTRREGAADGWKGAGGAGGAGVGTGIGVERMPADTTVERMFESILSRRHKARTEQARAAAIARGDAISCSRIQRAARGWAARRAEQRRVQRRRAHAATRLCHWHRRVVAPAAEKRRRLELTRGEHTARTLQRWARWQLMWKRSDATWQRQRQRQRQQHRGPEGAASSAAAATRVQQAVRQRLCCHPGSVCGALGSRSVWWRSQLRGHTRRRRARREWQERRGQRLGARRLEGRMLAWHAQARDERAGAEDAARAESREFSHSWAAHERRLRSQIMRAPLRQPWVPQMQLSGGGGGGDGDGDSEYEDDEQMDVGTGTGVGMGMGMGMGMGKRPQAHSQTQTYYLNTRTGRVQREHPHTRLAERLVAEQRTKAEAAVRERLQRMQLYIERVEDGERRQRLESLRALGFVALHEYGRRELELERGDGDGRWAA